MGNGRRRIGEAVVEKDNVSLVREAAVSAFEESWDYADPETSLKDREPIYHTENVIAVPGSEKEKVHLHIYADGDMIQIPDKRYLLKMLQVL